MCQFSKINRKKLKQIELVLIGWLSWLEHCSIHQKVVGSIPSQGTYLDCGFNSPTILPISIAHEEATNQCFSLLFLPLPLAFSLKSTEKLTLSEDL